MNNYSHLFAQIGDPSRCTNIANDLIEKHGVYVQAINYPTVARGSEMLRVAPTPHHTPDMMAGFVQAVRSACLDNGVELKSICTGECEYCKQPLKFEFLTARERPICDGLQCDKYILKAAA